MPALTCLTTESLPSLRSKIESAAITRHSL
jgi:hypothetical protein